ncbi:VPLPA-CTERM sorting domain-containing protein [Desulfosarcina variabilis]|uniref:VPLPA-CTERM sorting domain-containing protein n=1 Tax=Desulfosarcina variabilis TaxID=2300 RepID=UPI003AFAF9F4
MKKSFCVTIAAIVTMVLIGAPACEVSACLNSSETTNSYSAYENIYEGTIDGAQRIDLTFTDVPAGNYLATLTDTTGPSSGFLLLSLYVVAEPNTFLGCTSLFDEESGEFSFALDDTTSTLSLTIFGVSDYSAIESEGFGSIDNTFTVQLSSVPIPASLLLLGSGLAALTALKRKKL